MAAATYDLSGSCASFGYSNNIVSCAQIVVDFSDQNMANTETAKLMTIPAQTCILNVAVKTLTAEGASCTIDILDTETSPNTYIDDLDVNSVVAGTGHKGAALAAPVYYPAAGELRVLANTAGSNTARFVVYVLMANMADTRQFTESLQVTG